MTRIIIRNIVEPRYNKYIYTIILFITYLSIINNYLHNDNLKINIHKSDLSLYLTLIHQSI